MKKNSKKEFLNRDEVNEMIESAIRRHNRRSTIISSDINDLKDNLKWENSKSFHQNI